jgi:hypothetical protein
MSREIICIVPRILKFGEEIKNCTKVIHTADFCVRIERDEVNLKFERDEKWR